MNLHDDPPIQSRPLASYFDPTTLVEEEARLRRYLQTYGAGAVVARNEVQATYRRGSIDRLVERIMHFRSQMLFARIPFESDVAFIVSPDDYRALREYVDPWGRDPLVTPVEYDRRDATMRVHGVTVIPR